MIVLTATQDDCLADMLRDAIARVRDQCEDNPVGVCDDCLSRIQAYRDLAHDDLGLPQTTASLPNRSTED